MKEIHKYILRKIKVLHKIIRRRQMCYYTVTPRITESWSDWSGLRGVTFPSVIGVFLCELCLGLVLGDIHSFNSEVTAVGDSSPMCVSPPLLHINCFAVQTQITFIYPPFSTFDIKVLQGHCLYLLLRNFQALVIKFLISVGRY